MTIRSMLVIPCVANQTLARCMNAIAVLAFSSLSDSVYASRTEPVDGRV